MNPDPVDPTAPTLSDSEFCGKEKREAIHMDLSRLFLLYCVTQPLINGNMTGWVSQQSREDLAGGSYAKRISTTACQTKGTGSEIGPPRSSF